MKLVKLPFKILALPVMLVLGALGLIPKLHDNGINTTATQEQHKRSDNITR